MATAAVQMDLKKIEDDMMLCMIVICCTKHKYERDRGGLKELAVDTR